MDKKIAVIFGGTGGIGTACVDVLLKDGFHVCSIGYKNKHVSEQIIKNKSLSNYSVNLNNRDEVTTLINNILKNHGTIDCIVYSVSAPINYKNLFDFEWEEFEEHINTQVRGIFWVVKKLEAYIKNKNKVKFILLTSEVCIGRPPTKAAHYVTAKYALTGLAKCFASELSKYGCTFNIIAPGLVETNLVAGLPNKLIEMNAEKNPLKRNAIPYDVANLVSYLSSSHSDFLNGVIIPINGGAIMI